MGNGSARLCVQVVRVGRWELDEGAEDVREVPREVIVGHVPTERRHPGRFTFWSASCVCVPTQVAVRARGGARVGGRGRERIARGGLVRVGASSSSEAHSSSEVLGAAAAAAPFLSSPESSSSPSSAFPSSELATVGGVGGVGGGLPSPASRASSPPRIHASGTTLSLYSVCSARNGPRAAHVASRRCPASRRWRMRGVDATRQRISAASDPVCISPARAASAATMSPSPHSRR